MNVFENLVVELQEANLLEKTVIDVERNNPSLTDAPYSDEILDADLVDTSYDDLTNAYYEEPKPIGHDVAESADLQLMGNEETIEIRKPTSEREFFKKRAVSEVSSLQVVEHVLTSVEREQMKVVPRVFDDFSVKKALNAFLLVAEDISTDEHKQTEFQLMHETEAWCSALAERDKSISVAALRRYCETCKPMLSSQAMLAVARFYRNLPYSESIRGKFDFTMTRLFSRSVGEQNRKLLFNADDMLGHIKTLYADWSSIPLYSADGDESKTALATASFDELAREAESATTFDSLIKSDFFNRLRLFKESISETFFAPVVTAAAIECNIRVGNSYVLLIDRERQSSSAASVHDKYSFVDDQAVSDAAGRTLELVDMLRIFGGREGDPELEPDHLVHEELRSEEAPVEENIKPQLKAKKDDRTPTLLSRITDSILAVNKLLLLTAVILFTASVGLWVYTNYFIAVEIPTAVGVRRFDLSKSAFRDQLKIAQISDDRFYGVLLPGWETMTKEKKEELARTIFQAGQENGWTTVTLINAQGNTVAYASSTHFDLTNP